MSLFNLAIKLINNPKATTKDVRELCAQLTPMAPNVWAKGWVHVERVGSDYVVRCRENVSVIRRSARGE